MSDLAASKLVRRVGRQRNRLIVLLLVCGLTALLIRLPASMAAGVVNQACAQRCRLVQTTGHWWAGSGRFLVRATPDSAWLGQGEARWALSISTEWPAFIETPLQLDLQLAQGRITAGFGVLALLGRGLAEINARELHLPAELLPPLALPGLPGSRWSGNLRLRRGQWHRDAAGAWRTNGELVSQNLSVATLGGVAMDPLIMTWMADDRHGARFALASDQPPRRLRAAGEIDLANDGKIAAVNLRFDVGPEAPDDIRRMLSAVASAEASVPGRYIVKHRVEGG